MAQSTQGDHVERGQFTLTDVYWAGLVLQVVNLYCAYSFARNWQLPFLNQRKGENDRSKYFMTNLQVRMVPTPARVEPATGRPSNCATEASFSVYLTSLFLGKLSSLSR